MTHEERLRNLVAQSDDGDFALIESERTAVLAGADALALLREIPRDRNDMGPAEGTCWSCDEPQDGTSHIYGPPTKHRPDCRLKRLLEDA